MRSHRPYRGSIHGCLYVAPDKEQPDDWRVEDNDADGDGSCAVTIFSGFEAEKRSREYAEWLRSRSVRVP